LAQAPSFPSRADLANQPTIAIMTALRRFVWSLVGLRLGIRALPLFDGRQKKKEKSTVQTADHLCTLI
jgi:hypothetical protein